METGRRRRRVFTLASLALGVLLAASIGGFIWFVGEMPTAVRDTERPTDAIVVLTGGSGRLTAGLELLAAEKAEKLFVSGVYHSVEVDELLRLARNAPQELACCIVLGYDADDTRGNATETADWMAAQNYDSLRLVTAVYHMPRSLLEFRRRLPDAEILPHPVFPEGFRRDDWWAWPRSFGLAVSEYVKYLAALARGPFGG
ncbi:YdcF family protein [Algihabitans albus]|uniref:YdcF family protein n=1 Tax=Algihabitans albus TaxID=2164067 RepID=UPI001F35EC99|nr:YdcF family protein [Algihabitans albus]